MFKSSLVFTLALSLLFSQLAVASDILIIHSAFQSDDKTREIQKGIEKKLRDVNVSLYVNYLDSKQPLTDKQLQEHAQFLALKYQNHTFSAVIVSGENALLLAERHGSVAFPHTPVIFTGIRTERQFPVSFTHRISAVLAVEDVYASTQMALALFPNVAEIYVITGSANSSQLNAKKIEQLSNEVKQRLTVLSNETEESLQKVIRQATSNSVVIFSDFSQDSHGHFVNRNEMLRSLVAMARVPFFVVHKHDLIEGIIGGVVLSEMKVGEAAASKVLQIAQGVPIEALPVHKRVESESLLQYRELVRWGLQENEFVADYQVINRPQQYDSNNINSFVLILVLLILLSLLFWSARQYFRLNHIKNSLQDEHQRVQGIFNHSYDFIFILDLLGEIKMVNETALSFAELSEHQVKGTLLWDAPWWDHDASSKKQLKVAMGQARVGKTARFECRLLDKDQERHAFDVFIQPIHEVINGKQSKEISSVIVEARDISGIKALEEVKKAHKRSNLLLDESPSMLLMLNAQGVILSCNKFGCNLLGFEASELIGRNLVTLYTQVVNIEQLQHYLADCVNSDGLLQTREIAYSTKSGRKLWINERVRKLEDQDQYFLVCENITERHELSKELNYRASHDYLTGLKNRMFFENQLDQSLKEVQGASEPSCLMYLDMDKFKIINDTCGHHAGDEVLRQIATILTESVPARAIVARLGGDEFAIIIPQAKQAEAEKVAQIIIRSISKHYFLWEGNHFTLGVSIGLMELNEVGRGGLHALSCADSACYIAKQSGRNRIHIFEEDRQEEQRREEVVWVTKVQDALRDESRFCLYAQLIKPVDGDEDYLHYEILTRMIDESGKLAPPAKFIPVAESYNLADKIDMIIITKTLKWLKHHPDHLFKLNMCSINLSGQSLGDPQFVDDLVELLTNSSLPLEKLCFEITETVAIGNFSNAARLINSLKKLGCKLALDDFGTGVSSFGYLKRLKVDYLKIDGVFVKDMANDDQDFGIVKTIHELSHLFGKKTIAEYVEDEQVIEKLKEVGVDFAQGYHIGKPVPIDMMALLSDSLYEDVL